MSAAAVGVAGFDEALEIVLGHASGLGMLASEQVPLLDSAGRILAETVLADRDQPPFDRATRDGFAVQAGDMMIAELEVIGQIRAGEVWPGDSWKRRTAVEIMTGAPLPGGANAVVMVEHTERSRNAIRLLPGRRLQEGENVVRRGSEARAGAVLLAEGTLLEPAEIALAASCGRSELTVFCRPKVAVVATGDELVELEDVPGEQQIRNSNSYAMASLVTRAGAEPLRLPIARDRRAELEETIRQARSADLMLLSGGVSMGKYDLVEEVLQSLGAEFFFTGVWMQPGKPVVFGRLPATGDLPAQFFFGLPGNPISTQVTFHCFVEPLLRTMCGASPHGPLFVQATLSAAVEVKPGLMRILPARLTADRVIPTVCVVPWHGSGDLAANARANCYVVLSPEREIWMVGDVITVLLR